MSNLTTTYLGLTLKNPIIVGASSLSNDLEMLKQLEAAGAAAVVFKTLFEEQINLESAQLDDQLEMYDNLDAEITTLHPKLRHAGPETHLVNLRKAKEALSIPVIASLNCMDPVKWVDYALKIEKTGVDALELNFYFVPGDMEVSGQELETLRLDLIKKVIAKVKIPVSVKLSVFYSNPLNYICSIVEAGVKGVVIFNRMFESDININTIKHTTPYYLSYEGDYRLAMRYAGLLYGNINASICGNTGIYEGSDVIKMLLAGANCVQVVSTLYKNKPGHISIMLNDMEEWMQKRHYQSLNDFIGKLSKKEIKDPFVYKRGQYIELLLNSDQLVI